MSARIDPLEQAYGDLLHAVSNPNINNYGETYVVTMRAVERTKRARAIREVVNDVEGEYLNARKQHAPMHSAHEGYAVILEELDELWGEIKKKKPDKAKMRAEAVQVAAMAAAFVAEVCAE